MSLFAFQQQFPDEASCLQFLETQRWGENGANRYCPHCSSLKTYKFTDGKLFKCGDCRKKFTVKVSTMFSDSHIPLQKWFYAIYLNTSLKKGISSIQLAKYLDITQKTAWFMLQRIRHSVEKAGRFAFAITPPNTTRWIPGIVAEETNEWPIKAGTIYKLQNDEGQTLEVIVSDLKQNQFVEWVKDSNYHCRYSFKQLSDRSTELTYYEWVDEGELDEPFVAEALANLKHVLEQEKSPTQVNSDFTDIVKIMANTPPVSNEELKHRKQKRP